MTGSLHPVCCCPKQHTPLWLGASLAACRPPRAFGFGVWFRLSSGQAVVAVAWASLTLGARRDVPSARYISTAPVLPQREPAFPSATSGFPSCWLSCSVSVSAEAGSHRPVLRGGPLCQREDTSPARSAVSLKGLPGCWSQPGEWNSLLWGRCVDLHLL